MNGAERSGEGGPITAVGAIAKTVGTITTGFTVPDVPPPPPSPLFGGGGGGGTGAKTRTSRVVRTKVPRVVVEIANWPVEVSGEDAVALVIGV